ncbi:MAG: hypothetical protein IJU70_08865 [Lentisphaeria bacterium]|nr:hypothetical protein [Lentisphaeria bacterium]
MDTARQNRPEGNRTGEPGEKSAPAAVRHDGRKIDPVLKVNLAPLMGRRDAAFDRAADAIGSEISSLPGDRRHAVYDRIARLLALAIQDCDMIISGLSSQDTILREKHLRSFIFTLHTAAATLGDFTTLGDLLKTDAREAIAEFDAQQEKLRLAQSEKLLGSTEENLLDLMRRLFASTHPRLARYREYAKKSFSPVYAEKYAVAYRSCFEVYGREDF